MWDKIKEFWADILLIVALGWIQYHLTLIKIYGSVIICENNQVILWVELVVVPLIILLAIERLIKDLLKQRSKK